MIPYLVKDGERERLVVANNQAQVYRYLARIAFSVKAASGADVMRLRDAGIEAERAEIVDAETTEPADREPAK